jgi:thiamine biosynthesis lipoprotein
VIQPRIAIPPEVSPEAFRRRDRAARIVALAGATMGTSWSARIVSAHPPARLRAAIQRVLDNVIAQMSNWEAGSDISRFNRAPPGAWCDLPADFAQVLDAGLEIARASGGAFDPAAGALVDLWGFGPAGGRSAAPDQAMLAAAASGWPAIERDGARARRMSEVRLDLSGIAKGFAVDAVARALRALGAQDFLVEIGGELLGAGVKPDGQPWWVDLETPPATALAPLRVALHEVAVASSGDYRRFFEQDGIRYAHTVDPRTRRPVANDVVSATVLHASCMLADAWATALTVLGPEEGMALATRERLAARIVVRDGGEFLSPELAAMLG